MKIISLRSQSPSLTYIVYSFIPVTLQNKDFGGHYIKLVVGQGFTQLRLMNIVYFNENHIIEV